MIMNAALKVSGIDHVVFHVKDLARARKFYVDFLGLEVEHERDWQGAAREYRAMRAMRP